MSNVEQIRERKAHWTPDATKQLYEEAIQQAAFRFNDKMANIENRYLHGTGTEMELLTATTESIHSLCSVCDEWDAALINHPEVLKQLREEFREKTHQYFSKSYFMNHARTWPQGYPGDYKMLEAVYRNMPLSDGLGYLLDQHFLATALAVGVRERLTLLLELLRREMEQRQAPRVLDIACGSCREIFDLAPEIERSGAQITCIDQDEDALDFALSRLSYAPITSHLDFRKYNALRLVSHERNLKMFGQQDIIYSTGLFDYLTDDLLIRMLGALYALLRRDGKLICSFKDASRYRTQEYHWFVDWAAFFQRTEQESRDLFLKADIPTNAITTLRVRSGVMVFYVVSKQ